MVLSPQQLSLLPLMEPLIGVNFAHFAPYGSSELNGESLLAGTFGSASLDGVCDYYSQLAYKVRSAYLTYWVNRVMIRCLHHAVLTLYWFLQQSNLSNPPTPPASLPPTPPPVNRQKMINGFATTEELASKAAAMGKPSEGCISQKTFTYHLIHLIVYLNRDWNAHR